MTRPGTRLRALAGRFCSPSAMERLIDPVIADLQRECADALQQGEAWRGRWLRIGGYLAFWKVAAMLAGGWSARPWHDGGNDTLGRAIRFSGLATALTTGLLMWPPLSHAPAGIGGAIGLIFVYMLPQALAVTLPMGLVFGVLFGLRGRVLQRHSRLALTMLMLATCGAMLVIDGWLLPAANQAYRQLTFAFVAGASAGPIRLARGMNELNLCELWSKDAYQFHFRLALALAPIALGSLALNFADARRRVSGRIMNGILGAAICFAYYTLLYTSRQFALGLDDVAHGHRISGALAAWSPNLIVAAAALLLLLRRRGPTAADPSHPDGGPRSEDRPVAPLA